MVWKIARGGSAVFQAFLKKLRSKISARRHLESTNNPKSLSSSPEALGYEYEVFLSFRGPDTRHGFTDCLYRALHENARVSTFRDDEELRTGEEIGGNLFKAIAESKIHIPIFSKNYASSKWCLKELTFMLECMKKKEGNYHMILPVFYDVTPTEVQDQTGDYGSALRKHEKKYGPNVVQQWREALSEVGHLKGMDLDKLANGYQGKLIQLIVSKVLKKLKKGQLIVTDNLVGIDDHVEAVKQLLELGTNDVRIVGIWGMGGIGKTTLSKVIYNHILDNFKRHNFIQDVRETSKRKGLKYLQSLSVANLSGSEQLHFASFDEGMHELKSKYRGNRVLILLDDIDDTEQLDKLVIRHDSFGPGSRVILTTRNRDVLDRHEVDHVYEVEAMNPDDALKLFCKHAFRRDTPTNELRDLSHDIVSTTGGLPLALEVIGSSLSMKSKMIWKGTFEKLRIIPNKHVQDKLRISFDVLDYEQKQIFLDIACFFIGEDITDAFPMWTECCEFSPEGEIDVLVTHSLVKIGEDGKKIWMHDQLRDLGREIVRQENYKEPGKRSRLWDIREAEDVLANEMGSSNVEAIRCYTNPQNNSFTNEQFRSLSNLRFLDLDQCVRLAGDFENVLSSLRWLRWSNSSFDSLNNLHLSNLVSLKLSENNLTDDWKGWSSIQMMKLKVLDLSCSRNLTIPNFSAFPNLERLILSNCPKLEVVDQSIAKLKKLTYLNISWCRRLRDLPHELGSLKKLEFLDASFCDKLTQISSSIIGHLFNLQTLNLRDCISLEAFYALPVSLPSQQVDIYVSLITLDISECMMIKALPNLSNLKLLRTLDARNCPKLEELVGLDQLYALEKLDITKCSIKRLPDLSKLQKLEVLYARDCHVLQELVGLDELKALKKLEISRCKEIKRLPKLSKLKQLEELLAYGCEKLQEVVGFGELHELRVVDMMMWKEIIKLPDLSMLSQLQRLNVARCEKLEELVGLDQLYALERLDITKCRSIKRLPDLSKLQKLEVLYARDCYALQELVGLDELKSLKNLEIPRCKEIKRLPDLSKLKHLEELLAYGCEQLQEIVGFGALYELRVVDMMMCKEIIKLPDLSMLFRLERLNVAGCEKLQELVGLGQLKALKVLSISNCREIKKLPDLSKLIQLEGLHARGCEKLRGLAGLENLENFNCLSADRIIKIKTSHRSVKS